jgi:signal transduction histidine kinase
MAPKSRSPRLRVALVGDDGGESWNWVVGGNPVEVVPLADPRDIAKADVDLVLALAAPPAAESVASAVKGISDPPPVTILVSDDPSQHPLRRLIDVLISGKRDWETTFDAIVDPVALLDTDGRIVRANLGLARALGREIKQTIGVHYLELIGAPEGTATARRRGTDDPIAQSLEDGQPRTEETCYTELPGTQQVTTSPLRSPSGKVQGLVVILKDVTDFKVQQERMLQSSRLADIGLLAAGVAHEINTPLASIALRAESLLRSAEDARLQDIESFKNFPRYLKTIDEEIYRCKKIISALLEFSRSRKPEVKLVDLNALAEKAADLVSHQMKLKQVALQTKLDTTLPAVQADDGQLRQAMLALLMNALDATNPHGRVEIETRRESGETVSLSVADTGSGIPAEHLDKVFSPFFTTKPLGQGTGLGLAVVHGIVTAHGGEIKVDSTMGKGTRLSLVLPIKAAVDGGLPPEEPPKRRLARANILRTVIWKFSNRSESRPRRVLCG